MTPEQLASSGTEHGEQVALLQWCAVCAIGGPWLADNSASYTKPGYIKEWLPTAQSMPTQNCFGDLKLLFAINNAVGRSSEIHGARNKAEGVKSGVPDLCLPVMRRKQFAENNVSNKWIAGLFIELKRATGKPSDVSKKQNEWIDALRLQGYRVEVCFGWKQAREVLLDYLR